MLEILENTINHIIDNYYMFFFSKANVVGIGLGHKIINGITTKEPCLHVLVSKKLPLNKLHDFNLIPKKFLGIKTDVLKYTPSKLHGSMVNTLPPKPNIPANYFTQRRRPVQGGYSIGVANFRFVGTLGAIVFSNKDNTPYILGCSHTMTRENKPFTPILQPGLVDNGTNSDKIAYLYKTINRKSFTKASWFRNYNYVDAAIAQLNPYIEYSKEIYGIGEIKGIGKPKIGLQVKKVGRTTGYTTGIILTINATTYVEKSNGAIMGFKRQIVTSAMAKGGDSGSVLIDNNNNAIGLLMSGDDEDTTFNSIDVVCKLLNVHF